MNSRKSTAHAAKTRSPNFILNPPFSFLKSSPRDDVECIYWLYTRSVSLRRRALREANLAHNHRFHLPFLQACVRESQPNDGLSARRTNVESNRLRRALKQQTGFTKFDDPAVTIKLRFLNRSDLYAIEISVYTTLDKAAENSFLHCIKLLTSTVQKSYPSAQTDYARPAFLRMRSICSCVTARSKLRNPASLKPCLAAKR